MVLNSVNTGNLPDFHLPEPILGPQAWYGPDLRIANDWIHHFSREDIAEIEAAFTAAQAPDNLNELLELIDFPIHLITSENKARHPESSAPLQQLRTIAPSFNHVIFEGTGHFIPQEQPERLEKEIWQFVDSGIMNPL